MGLEADGKAATGIPNRFDSYRLHQCEFTRPQLEIYQLISSLKLKTDSGLIFAALTTKKR